MIDNAVFGLNKEKTDSNSPLSNKPDVIIEEKPSVSTDNVPPEPVISSIQEEADQEEAEIVSLLRNNKYSGIGKHFFELVNGEWSLPKNNSDALD